MYTVAICIPSYNNVKTMKRLMDSIAIQTFSDFVVIVTDDSDNREIEELIFEYKDVVVDYHKNEIRLGLSANTNMAIEMAQKYEPKYIKIMYHDDFFSFQDSLFKMVSLLENDSQSDIAFCGTYQVSDNGRYARAITEEQLRQLKNDFRVLFKGNYIGAPSATIVRNIGIYMDLNLVWEVDVEWYLRILAHNSKFVWSTEPLISITISNTQMTNYCKRNKELMLEEKLYVYDKHYFLQEERFMEDVIYDVKTYFNQKKIISFCKEPKRVYIYGAGNMGKACCQFLQNADCEFAAFIVSEGRREKECLEGHLIFEIQEIKEKLDLNSQVILALNDEEARKTVIEQLEQLKISFCFW